METTVQEVKVKQTDIQFSKWYFNALFLGSGNISYLDIQFLYFIDYVDSFVRSLL